MNGSSDFPLCPQKVDVIVAFQRFKGSNILKALSFTSHANDL